MGREGIKQPPLSWLVIVAACSICYVVLSLRMAWQPDDSYISYRYAKWFAAGEGLVWNRGERVEGYTNFLWTVVLGLLHRAGADIPTAAAVMGFICGALVLAAVAYYAAPHVGRQWAGLIALLLAISAPLAAWALSGMEVLPFTLAAVVMIGTYARDVQRSAILWRTALAALALVLLRADGIVLVTILGLYHLITRRSLRAQVPALAIVIGTFLLHLAWRRWFYGEWTPNTAAAKAAVSWWHLQRGADYAWQFLTHEGIVVLPGLLALKPLRQPIAAFAFSALAWILYVACIGGDFMPNYRVLIPALVIGIVPAAAIAKSLFRGKSMSLALVPIVLLLTWNALPYSQNYRSLIYRRTTENPLNEMTGKWMLAHTRQHDVIAESWAGIRPYYAWPRTFIDMLGLCDYHIAHTPPCSGRLPTGHEKWDIQYVLHRRPVIISALVDRPLLGRPIPCQDYAPVRIGELNGQPVDCMVRRDHIQQFTHLHRDPTLPRPGPSPGNRSTPPPSPPPL